MGKANGAIIGGRGGIGKTFGVSQELHNAKLVNFADIESEHAKMQEEISAYRTEHGFAVEDDDDENVIEIQDFGHTCSHVLHPVQNSVIFSIIR